MTENFLQLKVIEATRASITKTSECVACYVLYLQSGDVARLRSLLKQAKIYTAENRGSINKIIKTAEYISAEYAGIVAGVTADSEGVKTLAKKIKAENLTYSRFKRESAKKANSAEAEAEAEATLLGVAAVKLGNINIESVARQVLDCLESLDSKQFAELGDILQAAGFGLQKVEEVKKVA